MIGPRKERGPNKKGMQDMTVLKDGPAARSIEKITVFFAAKMGASRQVVLVANTDAASSIAAIYALEPVSGEWRIVSGPIKGNIGRNGFAAPGGKREGDGRTPTGAFGLGTAFGYAPVIDTKMPYRQIGCDDFWVDDVDSPDYNRWVKESPTPRRTRR